MLPLLNLFEYYIILGPHFTVQHHVIIYRWSSFLLNMVLVFSQQQSVTMRLQPKSAKRMKMDMMAVVNIYTVSAYNVRISERETIAIVVLLS